MAKGEKWNFGNLTEVNFEKLKLTNQDVIQRKSPFTWLSD